MGFDSVIGALQLYNFYHLIMLLASLMSIITFNNQDDIYIFLTVVSTRLVCYCIILYFISLLPRILQACHMHFLARLYY